MKKANKKKTLFLALLFSFISETLYGAPDWLSRQS